MDLHINLLIELIFLKVVKGKKKTFAGHKGLAAFHVYTRFFCYQIIVILHIYGV